MSSVPSLRRATKVPPVREVLHVAWLAVACGLSLWLAGCQREVGCLAGDDGKCRPPSACRELAYVCANTELSMRRVSVPGDRPLPDCFAERFGTTDIGDRGGIVVRA